MRGLHSASTGHGPGAAAFITRSPNLIACRDDRDDLFFRVRNDVVGFDHPRPFQTARRVLRSPLAIAAELEELRQKLDFLNPGPPRFRTPLRVAIHSFDIHLVQVGDRRLLAEGIEETKDSFVLPLGLGRFAIMLSLKCDEGVRDRLSRLYRDAIFDLRQPPGCGRRSRVLRERRTLR
jgi:hypothetical protein